MKSFFGGSAALLAVATLAATVFLNAHPSIAEINHSSITQEQEEQRISNVVLPEVASVMVSANAIEHQATAHAQMVNKTELVEIKNSPPVMTSSSVSATYAYVATAYSLGGRTASGRSVARGIIAADTRHLPLGTRVRLDAGPYSGEYVVADTGGAVRGRKIDIWVPNSREAMRFGRRTVKLTVLKSGARRR